MPNFLSRTYTEESHGDPLELLSSLAFETPSTLTPAPPPSSTTATADTVNSSVLCTGSWEIPRTNSTGDDSGLKSLDDSPALDDDDETQHGRSPSKVSKSPNEKTKNSSSRRSIMNSLSNSPRSSRLSVLGAASARSNRRTLQQKGSSTHSTSLHRNCDATPLPPRRQPSLIGSTGGGGDAAAAAAGAAYDSDETDEIILPGAEAIAGGSATPRPPTIRKGSSTSSGYHNSSGRPVRVSMTGTEAFQDISEQLVEAEPVKTEEEIKIEIKIDAQKKYQEKALPSKLLVAEEIDLESAEELRRHRRINALKGSWACYTSIGVFCCLIPVIVIATLISMRDNFEDDTRQGQTIVTTENPTVSPTFLEVVTPFLCEEAAQLDGNSSIVGSTRGAPFPRDLPVCSGLASNGFGAWFEFVGDGNVFDCTTCNPATNFDTQLSVFTGSCSKLQYSAWPQMTKVVRNHATADPRLSSVRIPVRSTSYMFMESERQRDRSFSP